MIQQWTYVYWDLTFYIVMHQMPDPLHAGRVISKEIDRGYHSMPWQPADQMTGAPYAAKQIEIGLSYATPEYPLRTCEGIFIECPS